MARTMTIALLGAGVLLAGGLVAEAEAGRFGAGPCFWTAQAQQPMTPGAGPGMGRGPGMGPGMGTGAMFQMLDTNGDGALSREEFVEQPRRGPMSGTEWAEQNRAARFDQLDANKDGKLTFDEMPVNQPAATK